MNRGKVQLDLIELLNLRETNPAAFQQAMLQESNEHARRGGGCEFCFEGCDNCSTAGQLKGPLAPKDAA